MTFFGRDLRHSRATLFCTIVALVWVLRLLQPKSSFPGFSSDYAAHMAIAYELYLKPQWILTWPLPYWGILLSHVMTWPFLALGLDISRAMLLVLDLSVIVTIYALLFVTKSVLAITWERRIASLLLFAATVPGMISMAAQGFYPQVVSWMFYVPFLVLLLRRGLREFRDLSIAALLLGFGVLCYPDAFLWFAPLWIMAAWDSSRLRVLVRSCAALAALAWIALLRGQVQQMWIDGGGGKGFELSLLVVGAFSILIFGHRPQKNSFQSRMRLAFLIYAVVVLGLSGYSHFRYGKVLYYARKNIYAVYYMVPLIALYGFSLRSTRGPARAYLLAGFFQFAIGLPQFFQGTFSEMYDYLLRARGPISVEDRSYVFDQRTASKCLRGQTLVLVPPESTKSSHNQIGSRIPRIVYANLGVGLVDPSSSSLRWVEGTQGFIEAADTWGKRYLELSGSKLCVESEKK